MAIHQTDATTANYDPTVVIKIEAFAQEFDTNKIFSKPICDDV